MKIRRVMGKTAQVYARNFSDLMGAYLLEAALRMMCLTPLLFLLEEGMAFLAWLCVPLYVLIALPARQNYALAMQDMLAGGRVLTPQLISAEDYFRKLGRGLLSAAKLALWMLLPAAAVLLLVQAYVGQGRLVSIVMAHWPQRGMETLTVLERYHELNSGKIYGQTMIQWFQLMGEDTVGGLINLLMVILASFLLPVLGCAVHCGARHRAALGCKKLWKGCRIKLTALWMIGLAAFVPFGAAAALALGSDLKSFVMGFAQMYLDKSFTAVSLGRGAYGLLAAAVLLIPAVPFKQLLPAVAARERLEEMQQNFPEKAVNPHAAS